MLVLVNFAYVAGIGAIVLSTVSVLACAVAVPILFARMTAMRDKLVRDAAAFKVRLQKAYIEPFASSIRCRIFFGTEHS